MEKKSVEQGCYKGWRIEGGFTGGHTSSCCSCSTSLAHDTDEARPTSSWMALAREKDRDWWSADLEDEMEKLEVEGGFSGAESGSMDPKVKVGHRSDRTTTTKEEGDEVKGAEYEEQGMEVDEAVPGMHLKQGGGWRLYYMRILRTATSTCRSPRSKKKSDTCGIRRNARLRA